MKSEPLCPWRLDTNDRYRETVTTIMGLSTAALLLLPGKHFGLWIASVIVLAVAMIIICLVKGERPRWRWGKD